MTKFVGLILTIGCGAGCYSMVFEDWRPALVVVALLVFGFFLGILGLFSN